MDALTDVGCRAAAAACAHCAAMAAWSAELHARVCDAVPGILPLLLDGWRKRLYTARLSRQGTRENGRGRVRACAAVVKVAVWAVAAAVVAAAVAVVAESACDAPCAPMHA